MDVPVSSSKLLNATNENNGKLCIVGSTRSNAAAQPMDQRLAHPLWITGALADIAQRQSATRPAALWT